MIPIIKNLAKMFSEVLKNAIDDVTPIIKGIVNVLKDVIDFIVNVFQGDWEGAWESIKNAVLDAFNLIITGIENGINSAIWLINKMINGVNSITTEIGIDAIPNIPEVSLPRFHTGGIIDFKGKYEALILAKDGEMILTQEQQKRLFDIASRAETTAGYIPSENNIINNNINNNDNQTYITNNITANVRSDSDIDKLAQQLSVNERRNKMAKGK